LVSPLTELCAILDKHDVGKLLPSHKPKDITETIVAIFANQNQLAIWKENTKKACEEYCWENEEKKLISILLPLL
jgi:hypothetical protein